MLHGAAQRSRYKQQQLGELDRRRLTAIYVQQTGSDDVSAHRRRDLIPEFCRLEELIGQVHLAHSIVVFESQNGELVQNWFRSF